MRLFFDRLRCSIASLYLTSITSIPTATDNILVISDMIVGPTPQMAYVRVKSIAAPTPAPAPAASRRGQRLRGAEEPGEAAFDRGARGVPQGTPFSRVARRPAGLLT